MEWLELTPTEYGLLGFAISAFTTTALMFMAYLRTVVNTNRTIEEIRAKTESERNKTEQGQTGLMSQLINVFSGFGAKFDVLNEQLVIRNQYDKIFQSDVQQHMASQTAATEANTNAVKGLPVMLGPEFNRIEKLLSGAIDDMRNNVGDIRNNLKVIRETVSVINPKLDSILAHSEFKAAPVIVPNPLAVSAVHTDFSALNRSTLAQEVATHDTKKRGHFSPVPKPTPDTPNNGNDTPPQSKVDGLPSAPSGNGKD